MAWDCLRSDVVALMQKYLQRGVQVSLPSRAESLGLCSMVNVPCVNQTLTILARYGVPVKKVDADRSWSLFCRDNEYPHGRGVCRFIIRG